MSQFAGKTFGDGIKMGWLACAIESEGSLQLAWGRKRGNIMQLIPRINLANKDSNYIEKVISISQELGFNGHVNPNSRKDKVKYVVWYGFKRVKRLLEDVLPYLTIEHKIKIANKILDFINHRLSVPRNFPYTGRDKEIFFEIRKLNGKGRVKFPRESSETIRQTVKTEDIVRSV